MPTEHSTPTDESANTTRQTAPEAGGSSAPSAPREFVWRLVVSVAVEAASQEEADRKLDSLVNTLRQFEKATDTTARVDETELVSAPTQHKDSCPQTAWGLSYTDQEEAEGCPYCDESN